MKPMDAKLTKTLSLEDRASYYEKRTEDYIPYNEYIMVRIDGKNFKNFTRGFNKPFDENLIYAFRETTKDLMKHYGAVSAFYQSDEITLVLPPMFKEELIEIKTKEELISNINEDLKVFKDGKELQLSITSDINSFDIIEIMYKNKSLEMFTHKWGSYYGNSSDILNEYKFYKKVITNNQVNKGRIQKMVSEIASLTTASFNRHLFEKIQEFKKESYGVEYIIVKKATNIGYSNGLPHKAILNDKEYNIVTRYIDDDGDKGMIFDITDGCSVIDTFAWTEYYCEYSDNIDEILNKYDVYLAKNNEKLKEQKDKYINNFYEKKFLQARFDTRIFGVPSKEEVFNMVMVRTRDCVKNSKTMFCQNYCSHNSLKNKNTDEMVKFCIETQGKDWNEIEDYKKYGIIFKKEKYIKETKEYGDVERRRFVEISKQMTAYNDENVNMIVSKLYNA